MKPFVNQITTMECESLEEFVGTLSKCWGEGFSTYNCDDEATWTVGFISHKEGCPIVRYCYGVVNLRNDNVDHIEDWCLSNLSNTADYFRRMVRTQSGRIVLFRKVAATPIECS